ncbi:WPP domain-interacting protein 2-like [Apium graveolens]|uniref:WPP domain-containing protein n=1 Tax=Apium graveolens TaxID=4045 RepID=A0A6L5B6K6_APIGR|nr:hypothetical protein AG4045_010234 [Apium graveolens]
MEMKGESSLLEFVEDNQLNLVHRNGACSAENVGNNLSVNGMKMKPEGVLGGSTPQVKKGKGLRRWKRVPRGESSKERGESTGNGKGGKRGLPNVRNSAETKQRSEGSVSSTNAVVRSQGGVVGGFDFGMVVGPNNFAATDSENSEDRSSKSSTAASAPRWRLEAAVGGYIGDNNGIASSNRDQNLVALMGQQGKIRTGFGKKPRGNQVKIEKENSHSSMESDSQSSIFVFVQGASSVTSKGRQSRRSANYDGENSDDEAQGSEQRFAEELQAGFRKNMAEFEEVSQRCLDADNIGLSEDQDPLLESITALQSAQDALAQELLKFREFGKDDSDVVQNSSPNLSEPQQYGETRQTRPTSLESEIVNLKCNVNELESKLADTRSMLKVKEDKVIELEASLNSSAPQLKENRKIIDLEERNLRELKSGLESLFKEKIEAEVESLVVSTCQDLKIAARDEITFLEEQKTLVTEQAEIVNLSENLGNRATMLKRRVDNLEIEAEAGEIVKLEKRICKVASLFFIQLVLLFPVLCFFVFQLVPEYTEDVPT